MTRPTAVPTAQSLRILALALTASPLVIGIALTFVLTSHSNTDRYGHSVSPKPSGVSVPAIVIEVGLFVVAALIVEAVGYRVAPLSAGLSDQDLNRDTMLRFQTAMFLRMAVCEAVAVVSIVIAFVASTQSPLNYWVGGVLSSLLLALHVYPNGRVIDRMTQRLEAGGVRSPLPETFGRGR